MKREIYFKGKPHDSMSSLLREYPQPDLSLAHFSRRINIYGWSIKKSLYTKVKKPLEGVKVKYNGKLYKSISDASKDAGVAPKTVRYRRTAGWPENKIFKKNPEVDNLKPITIDGKKYDNSSLAARSFGIKELTFLKRLRVGCTPNQAAGLEPLPIRKIGAKLIKPKDYRKRLRKVHGDTLNFKKSKFNKAQDKIEVICRQGTSHQNFWATPNNLLRGRGCPICKISIGCKIIARWLEKNKIKYFVEWTNHDLYSPLYKRSKLRFDFFIKKHNLIIEFDGEQHFRPLTLGRMTNKEAQESFKTTQRNDKLKNNWAKKNNIRMCRIKYDQHIIKILERKIPTNGRSKVI